MSSKMTHKGYTAHITYDERDDIFTGRVLGIRDIIGFHAQSVAELRAAFIEAVEHYIATCQQRGVEPQAPASGRLMLRIAPEVHRASLIAAQSSGQSLNQWAEAVLARATQEASA